MGMNSRHRCTAAGPTPELAYSVALVDQFLAAPASQGRAAETRRQDALICYGFSRFLGTRTVVTATTADVTAWLGKSPPLTPASRNQYLDYLSRFFGWLVENALVDTSPTAAIPRTPIPPRRVPATTPAFNHSVRLIGRFLIASAHQGRAASTGRFDEAVIVALARSLGHRSLVEASVADISTWLDHDPPVTSQTRTAYLARLHRFYSWLVEQGEVEASPTAGLRPAPSRSTDPSETALVDRFLASDGQKDFAPGTHSTKRGHLLRLARSLEGRSLLESTEADLTAWLERTRPSSGGSRASYLLSLSSFFDWAMDAGLIASSPVPAIRRPRRAVLVMDEPSTLPEGVWCFADLARLYVLTRLRRADVKENTATNTRSALRSLNQVFGNGDIQTLSDEHIDRWLELNAWQAISTRRVNRSYVKGFCGWLVRKGYLAEDPTADLGTVRLPRQLPRCLPRAAIAALLQACPDERATLIVLLQVQLGLRCCELAVLAVEHISFPEHSVVVHGKEGHERLLPVDDETWQALVCYLAGHPATTGPLLRSYHRGSVSGLSSRGIAKLVSTWMYAAGVKRGPKDRVSAHALRHTACTDMLRDGAHLRDVQVAMGHSSIETTQAYMPLVVDGLRSAMSGRHYGTPSGVGRQSTTTTIAEPKQLTLPWTTGAG